MALPGVTKTRYDQAARHLLGQCGPGLFAWLLGPRPRFAAWVTAQLTLPGSPQRLCDAVARLDDDAGPVAALVEVQTEPDALMPGRLMLAGALLWLTVKPTEHRGDRYHLLAVVINLTGVGHAARSYAAGGAEWTLRPVEVNLAERDAGAALDEVEAGAAPGEVLAFVPLMQRGDEGGIVERWKALARAEPDRERRGSYRLARVFAEKVGRLAMWDDAMEGVEFVESPVFLEMAAQARAEAEARVRAEGRAEGEAQGRLAESRETLTRVLAARFGPVPADLAAAFGAGDGDRLRAWLDHALAAASLEEFRQRAGV